MTYIKRLVLQGFKSFNKKIAIPFPTGFSVVCGPNGSGKCVAGSGRVLLADGGTKTIKEIVEDSIEKSRNTEKLEDGFCCNENPENIEVLSLDMNSLKIKKKTVSAFIKRKSPPFLLKIKTRTGKEIVATHYHPLFTIKDGAIKSTMAEELNEGIKIAVPRTLPSISYKNSLDETGILESFDKSDSVYIPYSEKLSSFIKGAVKEFGGIKKLSEMSGASYNGIRGVYEKQSVNVTDFFRIYKCNGFKREDISWVGELKSRGTGKIKIPKEINKNLARFLGYIISEGRNTESNQVWFVNSDKNILSDFSSVSRACFGIDANEFHYKPNATDSIIFSKALCKFMERVFGVGIGEKSAGKKVPEQIFSSDNHIAAEFLSALFEGDAYVCARRGKKSLVYIEYSSASRKLAEDVSLLLLKLGVRSEIKEKTKFATNSVAKTKRKYYSLYIYGSENLKRIAGMLNFVGEKRAAVEKIKESCCKSNPNIDLIPNVNSEIRKLVKLTKINVKKFKKTCPKLDAYCYNRCEVSREGLLEVLKIIEENGHVEESARDVISGLRVLASSDIFWDEITKIEKVDSEEWVYDLSIEENHNFIANGFIVHNSNIADALCFVLGKSSAKSMRADKLHELIFHGGHSKEPAEYAKVTLYLDNSKKEFPFEDDVMVSRKVNRRGVSIYKLNGKIVTKQEVMDVLAAARIFPNGHNIVLQGDVTQIIEMSPEERKDIIDEISGIAEFDQKKEKSQKELEKVDQKLKEVGVMLRERDETYQKLEREREAAIKYRNMSAELKKLRASLAHTKLSTSQTAYDAFTQQIQEKEKRAEELNAKLAADDAQLDDKQRELNELVKGVIEKSKDNTLIRDIEEMRAKILLNRNKMDYDSREAKRLEELIRKLEMVSERELSNRAAAEILKLKRPDVLGAVASLLKVPPEYQVAIEVAAGHHLEDIVVENDGVAVECIKYLKQNKIGRATFLPLNAIRDFKLPSLPHNELQKAVGWASDLIEYDPKYRDVCKLIFGSTLVVDKIDTSRSVGIGKVRMVTLDGDLVEKSGSMIGGFYRKKPKGAFEFSEIEEYRQTIKALDEEIARLAAESRQLHAKLEEKTQQEKSESGGLLDIERNRNGLEKLLASLRRDRVKTYEERLSLQAEINKLKIQRARTEAELDNSKIEFDQYRDAQEFYSNIDARTMESGIKQLVRDIEALGPVNMKAIEDFDRFRDEFEGLRTKYDKVIAERNSIVEMIAQIEQRKKETFMKTLGEISAKFKETFRMLANGDAELGLEQPDDIESGLDIKASPNGKKLLNIDSMSGGEKTLTALSFLFTLQTYRPAPFYVMDEVEAALDKANSEKIAGLIANLSGAAQFIVISHNDATIQAADRVYGVSMEKGESKMIGIELPK